MLRAAVARGVAPAIAFGIARGDEPMESWFAGREGDGPGAAPVGPTTRFDLASLTKPLTTTTWVYPWRRERPPQQASRGSVPAVADRRTASGRIPGSAPTNGGR